MSTQAIHHRERSGYGSWRYAVPALVLAVALAIMMAMANEVQTGGPTGNPQAAPQAPPQPTLQAENGPAAGHPLL